MSGILPSFQTVLHHLQLFKFKSTLADRNYGEWRWKLMDLGGLCCHLGSLLVKPPWIIALWETRTNMLVKNILSACKLRAFFKTHQANYLSCRSLLFSWEIALTWLTTPRNKIYRICAFWKKKKIGFFQLWLLEDKQIMVNFRRYCMHSKSLTNAISSAWTSQQNHL